MTHQDFVPKYLKGLGAEIGAHTTPVPGIKPIHIDKFEEFAGEKCQADYFGESVSLPFVDSSLDYIVASHVLEHSANPVQALVEWHRVLKPGGIAYIVVPDKRYTWDKARPLTSVNHMLDDFKQGTTDCDATHVDDFVYGIDWKEVMPETNEADVDSQRKVHSEHFKKQVRQGEEINIHFHVFDPVNFRELLESVSKNSDIPIEWRIVEFVDRFPEDCPHGILAILKKSKKGKLVNLIAKRFSGERSRMYPLLEYAKPFPQTAG